MSDIRWTRAWRRARETWAPIVAGGAVRCARCQQWIAPGDPWQLGHPADRPHTVAGNDPSVIAECRPEHRHCGQRASREAVNQGHDGRIVTAPRGQLWDDMS